jgi:hypothetical protein
MDGPGRFQPIPMATLMSCMVVPVGCGGPIPSPSTEMAGDASAVCSRDAWYDFGWSGGLSLSRDRYLLIPPDTFRVIRSYAFGQEEATCTTTVPDCGTPGRIDLRDVRAALRHPDVRNALDAAEPTLYGADLRPVDGGAWAMQRKDATGRSAQLFLGADCRGSMSCQPMPPGLRALRERLSSLAEQELATGACSAVGT